MIAPLAAVGVTRYHRPVKNFTSLRNSFVRDAQVSLRAFRVGAYVLSHAEGFTQTQAQIAVACGLAVNTVRAALRDLAASGYLASKIIRENGRVIGTAYAVSDTPFTQVELAQLTSDDVPSEPCAKSAHAKSAPPKKIRSRRDSSPGEEDQPSGGTADAGPVEESTTPEEQSMSTAIDPAQADLFGDMLELRPRQAGKTREMQGAQAVVAAYVTSWHEHHAEGEPLRADKGRIARDAKRMLTTNEATEQELVAAAQELGTSTWANIATAVKIIRRRGSGQKGGNSPAVPEGHPGWAALERVQGERFDEAPPDDEVASLLAQYQRAGVA